MKHGTWMLVTGLLATLIFLYGPDVANTTSLSFLLGLWVGPGAALTGCAFIAYSRVQSRREDQQFREEAERRQLGLD